MSNPFGQYHSYFNRRNTVEPRARQLALEDGADFEQHGSFYLTIAFCEDLGLVETKDTDMRLTVPGLVLACALESPKDIPEKVVELIKILSRR